MKTKGSGRNEDCLDPINTDLFNEIQRRADQFLIEARINISFYNSNKVDNVYRHFEILSKQRRLIALRDITDKGTMVAIYRTFPDEIEALDIILVAQQGIELVTSESLKALAWYKWYWPTEERGSKELAHFTSDPTAFELASSHIEEVTDKSLESLLMFITTLIQSAEIKSGYLNKASKKHKEENNDD